MAVEWELLHQNAAQGAKLPRLPEGRTRYLSPIELKAALEAAPEWMRAPMALAAFTGMRRGELLALRWLDVDLPNRRLYLRETKNGSLRVLVLSDLSIQVLSSLPQGAPGDLVLTGVDAQQLTVYTRRIFAKLGIHDASFHSLRHTAASWLVMKGVDLYAVGKFPRAQDPTDDAEIHSPVPAIHGQCGRKAGRGLRRSDAASTPECLSVSPRRVPAS